MNLPVFLGIYYRSISPERQEMLANLPYAVLRCLSEREKFPPKSMDIVLLTFPRNPILIIDQNSSQVPFILPTRR